MFSILLKKLTQPTEAQRVAAKEREAAAERALQGAYSAIMDGIENGVLAQSSQIRRFFGGDTFYITGCGGGAQDDVRLFAGEIWDEDVIDDAALDRIAYELLLRIGIRGATDNTFDTWRRLKESPWIDPEFVRENKENRKRAEEISSDIAVWRKPVTIYAGSCVLTRLGLGINGGYEGAFGRHESRWDREEEATKRHLSKSDFNSLFHKLYGMFASRVAESIAASRARS